MLTCFPDLVLPNLQTLKYAPGLMKLSDTATSYRLCTLNVFVRYETECCFVLFILA